ncbi:MAG: hypothetical protein K2M31_00020 [Muribaculaceae bacterium]|nr:hypothetical protein [Muribaculaceae bacterium]
MKVDNDAFQRLKHRVAMTFKCNPKTPTDFDLLALDIFQRTGRTISVSTLKRIWRYVNVEHGTSYSSLTILSRYVGYNDWDVFVERSQEDGNSLSDTSGFGDNNIIACTILDIDTELQLNWLPDKSCRIQKIGQPDIFRIVLSSNIKLKPGDIGHINSLQIGTPLVISGCRRGSNSLGTYHGASTNGIDSITLVE